VSGKSEEKKDGKLAHDENIIQTTTDPERNLAQADPMSAGVAASASLNFLDLRRRRR
jgi:hypothetical protein